MGITQAEHTVSNNQPIPSRTRTGDALLFARNFFRHPRMLGSIIPSSRVLINELLGRSTESGACHRGIRTGVG